MTDLPNDMKRALATLPRERQPSAAFEDRVVRVVVGARRRGPSLWVTALGLAAALVLVLVHPWSPTRKGGATYVMLLYEDSSFRHPAPGHNAERIAEYVRWTDSLNEVGQFDRAGQLAGQGAITGLFIVRAANDVDAAHLATTCPHVKYGGRVEVRRFVE